MNKIKYFKIIVIDYGDGGFLLSLQEVTSEGSEIGHSEYVKSFDNYKKDSRLSKHQKKLISRDLQIANRKLRNMAKDTGFSKEDFLIFEGDNKGFPLYRLKYSRTLRMYALLYEKVFLVGGAALKRIKDASWQSDANHNKIAEFLRQINDLIINDNLDLLSKLLVQTIFELKEVPVGKYNKNFKKR